MVLAVGWVGKRFAAGRPERVVGHHGLPPSQYRVNVSIFMCSFLCVHGFILLSFRLRVSGSKKSNLDQAAAMSVVVALK